jgi:protein-tyrosine-phosphatase
VVCTGNIIRSAMAEAMLRVHLRDRAIDATVRSAGTLAWDGAAHRDAVEVLRERGVDLRRHVSQPLTAGLVADADLVLAMARTHLWGVLAHDAAATSRTFLLPELVRLGDRVGARSQGEPVRDWAARLAAARPEGRAGGRPEDEVVDPLGEPFTVFRATAARLDDITARIAALVAPL